MASAMLCRVPGKRSDVNLRRCANSRPTAVEALGCSLEHSGGRATLRDRADADEIVSNTWSRTLKRKRSREFFSPAQLAAAVGMTVEEVHALIDADLLRSSLRTREFTRDPELNESHLNRLRIIKRAFVHGFQIEQVRRMVDHEGMITCRDVYEMAERNLPALRQCVGDKAPAVLTLERLMSECPKRGGRRDCPIIGALETGNISA
jgi:DNA-binding transcriptional MerR regulator